jgi:hypothetical protein
MAMTFKIKETGEIKTLTYIDCNTGVDGISDLIGNSGAIGQYIEEDEEQEGVYSISQANFDWWEDYIDDAESDDQELYDLRDEYNNDDIWNINNAEWNATGNDYDDHHDIRQRVIERIKVEARHA